jgi:hypothetical protein
MKKTIALSVLCAALLCCAEAGAQLVIGGGFLNRNANMKTTMAYQDSSYRTRMGVGKGYYGGVTFNYDIWKGVGVSLGTYFSYSKHEEHYTEAIGSWEYKYSANYEQKEIDVPILGTYRHEFFPEFYTWVYMGPEVRIGLSVLGNKQRVSSYDDVVDWEEPIDFYAKNEKGESIWRKFDIGFMIGTGVQYYGVRFDMGYSFGLLERSNEGIKNVLDVQKARYETVLVGHFFVGLSYSFLNDIYNK